MTIDAEILREYRKLRTPDYKHYTHGWQSPAHVALQNAQTRVRFSRIGAICYTTDPRQGAPVERAYMDYGNERPDVRLVLVPDYDAEYVFDFDCCGVDNTGARWQHCDCRQVREHAQDYPHDAYNAQDRCQYGQPCRHKCNEARRIEREGVNGIVAEYRDPDLGWTVAESCWGFVGDDWRDGCEDVGFMAAAMRALIYGPAC